MNVAQHILESRRRVLRFAEARSHSFRSDFIAWLAENMVVWERFEREADAVYETGRKRYSARTIGEFLRHETALASKGDGEWKLNDKRWPDLARLWLLLNPEKSSFFELRESPQRKQFELRP